jgi:predicted transcriptional regulator
MNRYSIKMNISKNTVRIIEFLLRNINKVGFNVNQLARNVNISVGSAHKILHELKKEKVMITTDMKSSIYYRLNFNNPDTIDTCKLILRGIKRNLSSYIKVYSDEIEKFEQAEVIILFGSILIKKEFNDVDVLFVTNKVKETSIFCNEISKIRTKPINPLIMRFDDLVDGIIKENKVILDILNKGIVIKGEDRYMEALKDAG